MTEPKMQARQRYIFGIMHQGRTMRPLGWDEYQMWLTAPLPYGWMIIAEPYLVSNAEHRARPERT